MKYPVDILVLSGAVLALVFRVIAKPWLHIDVPTADAYLMLSCRWAVVDILTSLILLLPFLGQIRQMIKRSQSEIRWGILMLYGIPSVYILSAQAGSVFIPYYVLPYLGLAVALGETAVHLVASILLALAVIRGVDIQPKT